MDLANKGKEREGGWERCDGKKKALVVRERRETREAEFRPLLEFGRVASSDLASSTVAISVAQERQFGERASDGLEVMFACASDCIEGKSDLDRESKGDRS